MGREKPCKACTQRDECDMQGDPLMLPEVTGLYTSCFYYLCVHGEMAACRALRQAKKESDPDVLLPFGSKHKPFRTGIGRYIAASHAGPVLEPGAIYVRSRGRRVKVKDRIQFR